jgi:hypothetical protein
MERLELVFLTVFENDETFKNLSQTECKLLLNASCSMSVKNKNVKCRLVVFQQEFEAKQLCVEICRELEEAKSHLESQYDFSECD